MRVNVNFVIVLDQEYHGRRGGRDGSWRRRSTCSQSGWLPPLPSCSGSSTRITKTGAKNHDQLFRARVIVFNFSGRSVGDSIDENVLGDILKDVPKINDQKKRRQKPQIDLVDEPRLDEENESVEPTESDVTESIPTETPGEFKSNP